MGGQETTGARNGHGSHNWQHGVAATIGNVLEWFDFLVYGFFAVTIAARCQGILGHSDGADQGR